MHRVELRSVVKVFRERPWFGRLTRVAASETPAARDISLSVGAGEVRVLLGPNGSGKTTLLKIVSTLLLPDSGQALVFGYDTAREGDEVRRTVALAVGSQRSFFPRLNARENLTFFATLDEVPRELRTERIDQALATVGLREAEGKAVMGFSSGMTQRLAIARALLKKPGVLLLDEPSNSLDAASQRHLWSMVRETAAAGCAVILATHNFNEAIAVGNSITVLQTGAVVAQRSLDGEVSIRELREWYFQTVERSEQEPLEMLEERA